MRTLFAALVIVAVAGSALAGIHTTKPMGPLNLYIDAAGVGTIVNDGAVAFKTDGFTVESAGGLLVPAAYTPIGDRVLNEFMGGSSALATALGQTVMNGMKWTAMSNNAGMLSEAYLNEASDPGGSATLQPGTAVSLGAVFPGGTQADLTFTYVYSKGIEAGLGTNSWEGMVIPEPATMSLLGLGALALIRRRR